MLSIVEKLTRFFHCKETIPKEFNNDSINHLYTGMSQVCDSNRKVQVGKDQEKAQSEKDSHSKNRGGKKPN